MSRSSSSMGGLGKFTELRQRLLFVLGALLVYRVGSFIPVPGVNPDAMLALMEQQKGTIVDMFNMFSGGALSRFSLFALNVIPYISASIVIQLLVQIMPSLKAIQKEGESGRRRITQWSRIGAIPLAIFQAAGIATALQSGGATGGIQAVYSPGMGFIMTAVVALTAGTRSEEHTSELQSLMRISYAVFCLKKKNNQVRNKELPIIPQTTSHYDTMI